MVPLIFAAAAGDAAVVPGKLVADDAEDGGVDSRGAAAAAAAREMGSGIWMPEMILKLTKGWCRRPYACDP